MLNLDKKHITRLDLPDYKAHRFIYLFNMFILFVCWALVFVAIIEYMLTSNAKVPIKLLMFIPFRYFFFDLAPDRLQRRPPSLDREIPVSIFINYLRRKFPIPNGNFIASLWGFLLAVLRAIINGYCLLYFDTFFFFFTVRNTPTGIPLEFDESMEKSHKNLDKFGIETKDIEKYVNSINLYRVNDELTRWDFPIRRYRNLPNFIFETKEISSEEKNNKNSRETKR